MINIPKRFENSKYEDVPENIKECFEAIPDTRQGIYIHGGVGTGKTHIAYALLKEATERKIYCSFYNTTEMFREFRRDIRKIEEDEKGLEEYLMNNRGLVIFDDMGAEKLTEWVAETFYLIINIRYEEMLPTIFTSNLNLKEMSEKIGDRTVSRIAEMCNVIKIEGKDRRLNS